MQSMRRKPAAPAQRLARRNAAGATASADPATTASATPWPLTDRVASEPIPNALAYAAQPTPIATARTLPMGVGTSRAAPVAAPETTIAVKRSDDRPSSVVPTKVASVVRVGDRFNDPWMRAMIVSPSAQNFLRTTLLGATDFRNLGPYLQKPDDNGDDDVLERSVSRHDLREIRRQRGGVRFDRHIQHGIAEVILLLIAGGVGAQRRKSGKPDLRRSDF